MISQQQQDVLEGPIDHPDYGLSLMIRPTVETSRANRFPTQAVVVTVAARKLIEMARENVKLKAVVVQNDACDPTEHPDFHEITENLRALVSKHYPKAKLVLISNAPSLARPQVRHALLSYDLPTLRLEAGFQKTFAALSGEDPKLFKERVTNMGRLESERLVLQATFVRGEVDNSKDNEVRAWVRHLEDIKPAKVQISTPKKAQGKKTRPITKTRITQIAELVTERTGIPVEVAGQG